jgi:hypothetical protein
MDEGREEEEVDCEKDETFVLLAAARCRLLRAQLWDIETIDEFDYILARIYSQTQSFASPRIVVNFTIGKDRKSSKNKKQKNKNSHLFDSFTFTKKSGRTTISLGGKY